MPHSSAPVGGRFGRVETLPFDLVERNAIIEAVVRFRENVELRFDELFCGGFGGAAVTIWLEERKSENEDGVCGACSVFCSAGVKTGRGPPTSGELRGLLTASSPTSSSSKAKRCLMEGSIGFIGLKRPPNSSPGSPRYIRPSASVKLYLRVFES